MIYADCILESYGKNIGRYFENLSFFIPTPTAVSATSLCKLYSSMKPLT